MSLADDSCALQDASVLVVDDEPAVLSLLAEVLSRSGCRVFTADSAEAALAVADEVELDVALCDRRLPGMDGVELLQKLRLQQPMCSRILISGGLDLETTLAAVNLGAAHRVIEKPIRAGALRTIVQEALKNREQLALAYGAIQSAERDAEREMLIETLSGPFLQLAFQPIVRASDSTRFGVEALLRSTHRDLTGPAHVLAAVEHHDMVERLADIVAELAARYLDASDPTETLFLNLHPFELADPAALGERLSRLGAHASRIVLEITERSSIHGVAAWQRSLDLIRSLGFRIAVDDLGAGYSALAVLAELQPTFIKVDMSIIRDADTHAHKRRLIDLLCRFAEATDATLVAEGIETATEAAAVRECGAHLLQGFYFGRPKLPGALRLVAGEKESA